MAVFNVTPVSIPSGAERHGAAVDPPDRVTAASVTLVDGGTWDTASGTIQRWGVQASDNTGANFAWSNQGSIYQDNVTFGNRSRNGGMPMLRMASFDANGDPLPIAPVGVKLRLAIQVSATITLGATVKTNADA